MNGRHLVWLRVITSELEYPQDRTEIFCDITCAIGTAHDFTKMGKSKAMDMRFYCIKDRVKQGSNDIKRQSKRIKSSVTTFK